MATVSVVIPVWNGECFIKEAIESAVTQTLPPLEIIVVNDGSRDGTERIVREIVAPIPIRYHFQDHAGVSVTRNVGVSLAQGDWIAFLDSDDQWYPDKLRTQLAYADRHPETPLVYSLISYMDERGTPIPAPLAEDALGPLLYQGQPLVLPSTTILSRDTFAEFGGFTAGMHVAEDTQLFARIAHRYPVICVPYRLVRYRVREGQASRDIRLYADTWADVYKFCLELWGHDPLRHAALMRETWLLHRHVMWQFLEGERLEEAERFRRRLDELWKNEPSIRFKHKLKTSRLYYEVARHAIEEGRFREARPLLYHAWLLRPRSIRRLFRLLIVWIPWLRGWYARYLAARRVDDL